MAQAHRRCIKSELLTTVYFEVSVTTLDSKLQGSNVHASILPTKAIQESNAWPDSVSCLYTKTKHSSKAVTGTVYYVNDMLSRKPVPVAHQLLEAKHNFWQQAKEITSPHLNLSVVLQVGPGMRWRGSLLRTLYGECP